eukprot:GILJ01034423.1.p1 GENE.GILJ01034423.1~~GILJ01034423.1.p1  ORF type:complete len:314 (+),score=50.19 GILJ01034423.1:486-1427(+)
MGHIKCGELLLSKGARVVTKGFPTLHLAIAKVTSEYIDLLVDNGSDVNAKDRDGWTALRLSAQLGQAACMARLIARGARVLDALPDGTTTLHIATKHGKLDCMTILVTNGANVKAVSSFGNEPIHLAPIGGEKATEYLLCHGADVTSKGDGGKTALISAATYPKAAKVLGDFGSDVNAVCSVQGFTALHYAAMNGGEKELATLADLGADLDAPSPPGFTPLLAAVYEGNVRAATALVELGAKVDSTDSRGTTPLHFAASKGNLAIVELLVSKGASLTLKAVGKLTPLECFEESGFQYCGKGDCDRIRLLLAQD